METLQILAGETEGTFELHGDLGAAFDLSPLFQATSQHLMLNLAGIHHINSVGVRLWLEGIRSLRGKHGKTIELYECSYSFVTLGLIVRELFKEVRIHSIQVHFLCEDCNIERPHILEAATFQQDHSPLFACPTCGGETLPEDEGVFTLLQQHAGGVLK